MVEKLSRAYDEDEYCVRLLPPYPFLKSSTITAVVEKSHAHQKNVLSVIPLDLNTFHLLTVDERGVMHPVSRDTTINFQIEDAPELYALSGAVQCASISFLLRGTVVKRGRATCTFDGQARRFGDRHGGRACARRGHRCSTCYASRSVISAIFSSAKCHKRFCASSISFATDLLSVTERIVLSSFCSNAASSTSTPHSGCPISSRNHPILSCEMMDTILRRRPNGIIWACPRIPIVTSLSR